MISLPKQYFAEIDRKNSIINAIIAVWPIARQEYYYYEGYQDYFKERGTKWLKEYLTLNIVDDENGMTLNTDGQHTFDPGNRDLIEVDLDATLMASLFRLFSISVRKPLKVAR
jgi:hypothetical protein